MKEELPHPVFKIISASAEESGVQAFVIGGWVRDLLLHRPCKDIDIVCTGSGIELAGNVAKRIGENLQVNVFKNFGTAQFRFQDYDIEFVGARKESYRGDSRKPLVESGTLEDDQQRRDFTITALALSLQKNNFGELIDPFNGIQDLENRIIRTPLQPDITYSDDPLPSEYFLQGFINTNNCYMTKSGMRQSKRLPKMPPQSRLP